MEQLFEQPDLSVDIKDNGRVNVSLLPLNQNSIELVNDISPFLKSLPPFQHHDRNANMSLRVLKGIPYWGRERKGESEGLLNGSKKIYCLFCIAKCKDIDDLTDASSTYVKQLGHLSNPLIVTRCLVFGSGNDLSDELKGKSGFILIDSSNQNNQLSFIESQILQIIKHCITVIYSNITMLLGDKRSQKKAGSLPHSIDTPPDEDELRRQQGRSCKAQGDYYLLLGEYTRAIELYREGLAIMEKLSKKENLWFGAIFEGILSVNILKKFWSTANPISFELSYAKGLQPQQIVSLQESISFNDKENISETAGSGDVDIDGPLVGDIHVAEDRAEKDFNHAIQYYSKAGVIGKKPLFELYLKYAGYLVEQENYTSACKQLNEAQIVLSSEESLFAPIQLSLYLTLCDLYHTMGLKRKTLFMMFNAGREAVKMSSNSSDMQHYGDLRLKGFDILTHSLKEFGMVSKESDKDEEYHSPVEVKGWPLLQAMLLVEYIHLCWKMNNYSVLIRWAWLCLQTFHSYLPPNEIQLLIETITKSANKIKDQSGDTIVPAPFPLSTIPHITQLKPQVLPRTLSVKQSQTLFSSILASSETKSPFIYSAMNKKDKNEILWVQGDPAEVLLVLRNPLPVEMKVEKMTVVLKGGSVSVFPSQLSLPVCREPQELVLLCIPSEPGQLSLTGYNAFVFGLLNTSILPTETVIKVLPSLPQLRAKIVLKDDDGLRRSSSSLRTASKEPLKNKSLTFELLDGEVYECILQLQSIGDVSVDAIKISVKDKNSQFCTVSWEKTELQSLTPMNVKNKKLSLPLKLTVKVPSSQRIGPSKMDESHVHRSVLRRRLSKPKTVHSVVDTIPKSKTITPVTRLSVENEDRDSSRTPSPLSSPSHMKKISGSFRRPKKTCNETKPSVKDDSDLLKSLDLHRDILPLELQTRDSVVTKVDVHVETTDDTSIQNRSSANIKDTPGGTPKISSRSTIRRSIARLKQLADKKTDTTTTNNDVLVYPKTNTTSQPIPINDQRLVDSLNLEYPLAHDLRVVNKDCRSRDSTLSDNTTDTTSDNVDFDTLSGDRVSISSDPGSLLTSGKNSATPIIKKSNTMSMSQKRLIIGNDDSVKRSATGRSSYTTRRKKPLIPVNSLPMGNATSKPMFSPELPVLLSPERSSKTSLQEKQITMDFLLQYTGGEGAKEGYYREVSMDFNVSVRPALYFCDFSVIPVKGSADQFSFLFVMENVSPYNLEVTIDVKQEGCDNHLLVLDSHTTRDVSIVMKRFTLEDHEATLNEKNILKPYCDHLVSLLDIKWHLPDQNKSGNLTLTGLELPQSVVASIRPLPVIFNYKTEAMSYSPGIPVTVIVDITNNTNSPLPPCAITLKPFTISSNGTRIDCIKNKTVIHSQSMVQWLPELSVDFTYKLMLNIIFLCKDEYIIDVILHKRKEEYDTDHHTQSTTDEHSIICTRRTSIIEGSAVLPITGQARANFTSKQTVVSLKDAKLGNINEFIMQSKAYAGPQLNVKINN